MDSALGLKHLQYQTSIPDFYYYYHYHYNYYYYLHMGREPRAPP